MTRGEASAPMTENAAVPYAAKQVPETTFATHKFLKPGFRNASQIEVLLLGAFIEGPFLRGRCLSFQSPSLFAREGVERHDGTRASAVSQPGNGRSFAPGHDVAWAFESRIDPTEPRFSAGRRRQLEF